MMPLAVVLRQQRILLPALALLILFNHYPDSPPDGAVAVAAYWVAESGHVVGIAALVVLMTILLTWRSGISPKGRVLEAVVLVLTVGLFQGGGAWLNEHVLKPTFQFPRPNIRELARTPPNAPVLGLSAVEFYTTLPDKESRRKYLDQVLTPELGLHPLVRKHWLAETGYSFPSGHSFSAFTFATFFLALGMSTFTGPRVWPFYLLVPWALAVCFSRPILQVHTPTDVFVGAVEGYIVGTLAFLLARRILASLPPPPRGNTTWAWKRA